MQKENYNKERQKTIERLYAEKCSCIISNRGCTRAFSERGVKDLYRLLKEEPESLSGAFVADKVIGKGAAALLILGKAKEVFAAVISRSAYNLLSANGIRTEYKQIVPHIVNRTQTDWCPLEKICTDADTAEACLPLIENFIATASRDKEKTLNTPQINKTEITRQQNTINLR